MRLNSLVLTNFRQHVDSRIRFDRGLTGVIGPNGAGKSTILEASAWALYGQPAVRGNRDSIRFSRAGPRATVRVELDFDLAGHRYRVVRGLTSADLFLDGADSPIANSISAVSEVLQRRLGMTRTEFFHTYFTGQKELGVMASMGPSERAQFLSRVLGYERLRVAQEAERERRREMAAELNAVRELMPDAEAVARAVEQGRARMARATAALSGAMAAGDAAASRLSAVAPTWADAQAARERHQEIGGELRVAEPRRAPATTERDRIGRELEDLGAARAERDATAAALAPLAPLVEEYARLDELAREEGRRGTLLETLAAVAEELSALRDKQARAATAPQVEEEVTLALEEKRRLLEETLGRLEAEKSAWDRDRQEAETKRDALRSQYGELKDQREQILSLGEDGVCPTCTRVLGGAFRTVLDQLDAQMETITVDGRYYSTRLEQLAHMPPAVQRLSQQRPELQKDVGALERQLARVQAAVLELAHLGREIAAKELRHEQLGAELRAIPSGYDATRHEALRPEIDRFARLNEVATRLNALLERAPALTAAAARVAAAREALETRRAELAASREALRFSEADYSSVRAEQERAMSAAQRAEVDLATARAEVAGARAALAAAEHAMSDLARAQARMQDLQRDRRLHDELDRAYTDLRTDLNNALRPEISELASSFLADLTDHRYSELELDDQYNVVVLEDGRPKPVISGGEEDLANLVIRLAISQMIAERAGQAFSLLVLDEVFGSLDDARRHNVVGLLRRLEDRFEQVVLITHIESVRDGLDRVINVDYNQETGASSVRVPDDGALPWESGGDGAALAGAGSERA